MHNGTFLAALVESCAGYALHLEAVEFPEGGALGAHRARLVFRFDGNLRATVFVHTALGARTWRRELEATLLEVRLQKLLALRVAASPQQDLFAPAPSAHPQLPQG
jgi:hypothetical protein